MPHRKNDMKSTWFHSDRTYHTPEGWWFSSREHTEEGPFQSEKDCEVGICLYLRDVNLAQNHLTDVSKD